MNSNNELIEKLLKEKELFFYDKDSNAVKVKIRAFDVLCLIKELCDSTKDGVSEAFLLEELLNKSIEKLLDGEKKEDLLLRYRYNFNRDLGHIDYESFERIHIFLENNNLVDKKDDKFIVTENGKNIYKDIVNKLY